MGKSIDRRWDDWELAATLRKYSGLTIVVSKDGVLVLSGDLEFVTIHPTLGTATHLFQVEIHVPPSFPRELPAVWETGGRVPPKFHKHTDGSLCLGSDLALRVLLGPTTTLLRFIERCMIPYFFGFTVFRQSGALPFGELEHGDRGLLDEYKVLLGTVDDQTCVDLLGMAGLKKRIANKLACPCCSGKRVGRCHHRKVNRIRPFRSRSWFRLEAETMQKQALRTVHETPLRNAVKTAEEQPTAIVKRMAS